MIYTGYQWITHADRERLQAEVNRFLAMGYECVGAPFQDKFGNFHQAIVIQVTQHAGPLPQRAKKKRA